MIERKTFGKGQLPHLLAENNEVLLSTSGVTRGLSKKGKT